MNRNVLLVLFVSTCLSAIAQISTPYEIQWGSDVKVDKKSTLNEIVAYNTQGFIALKERLRFGPSEYTLELYNNSLSLLQSKPLVFGTENKRYYHSTLFVNDKLHVLSSELDKKNKTNAFFKQDVDPSNLLVQLQADLVAEIDYKEFTNYNSGNFSVELSADTSKVLIYSNLPYDKNANEKYNLKVYTNTFDLLWEKNVELPYSEKLFSVEDYVVDNAGCAYLIGKVFNEKAKSKLHGEPNYKYVILAYRNNGNEVVEYPVELTGKFLTEMTLRINNQGNIVCAGFYSEQYAYDRIKGSYFVSIDPVSKQILSQNFKDFAIDVILEDIDNEKKAKKAIERADKLELPDYELRQFILRDDGGAMLVAEQYRMEAHTYTMTTPNGGTTTYTVYYYYYQNIVVVNINPQGQIDWVTVVPKYQVTTNDGGFFSSYALHIKDDKLFFVYNDDPRNVLGEKRLYSYRKNEKAVVSIVELSADGTLKKDILFKNMSEGVMIRPKACQQVSPNEMILFGQLKKTHKFAKIKL